MCQFDVCWQSDIWCQLDILYQIYAWIHFDIFDTSSSSWNQVTSDQSGTISLGGANNSASVSVDSSIIKSIPSAAAILLTTLSLNLLTGDTWDNFQRHLSEKSNFYRYSDVVGVLVTDSLGNDVLVTGLTRYITIIITPTKPLPDGYSEHQYIYWFRFIIKYFILNLRT